MKLRYVSLLILVLLSCVVYGQTPEKLSYQAVVRNASGDIIPNQLVGLQLILRQASPTGTAIYTETFTLTTNDYGLIDLAIGTGTTTDNFSTINWANGPFFIETSIDITGGTTYALLGTTELLSVPFALYAKNATQVTGACGLSIGDPHQGGIIFYLDASGCHGLIAAPTDQSTNIRWDTSSPPFTPNNAFANGVFDGYYNAKLIAEFCGADCAANELCFALNLGGFDDWYLPTAYQLKLMYDNIGQGNLLGLGNIGGFASTFYWSSTEDVTNTALTVRFSDGSIAADAKNDAIHVRAIRQF
ncbi:MAG: DUF1566 domain-containing protein [Flavobacteriaceae bacterium]|nr:DUF1566 domain-containing protein [Flavobacteriaceae bacterium]